MAVVLGLRASSRDRLVGQLAAEVDQLATERELRVAAARLAERTALAAEMHDALAHGLSVTALQTGVLCSRSEELPEPVAHRIEIQRSWRPASNVGGDYCSCCRVEPGTWRAYHRQGHPGCQGRQGSGVRLGRWTSKPTSATSSALASRVSPEDRGLPGFGGRRRVPGLRREELALLAGISAAH